MLEGTLFTMTEAGGPITVCDIAQVDPNDLRRYGGKATGLARMAAVGLAIPPAFVISTDGYRAFRDSGGTLPEPLLGEVRAAVRRLELATGKDFAATSPARPPLLVSVRSGAAISMPGMMDTVLNLGLDAATATRLSQLTGRPAFVVDTWVRFWRMYADTVLDLNGADLAKRIAPTAEAARAAGDAATFLALEQAIMTELRVLGGEEPGVAPMEHLESAIAAVFRSWDSKRAIAYRNHHGIPHDLGTAVTVQAMVFGNLDEHSGSGVAFTRDPNTGEAALYGEYLTGRQGEDLVAGTHTPISLNDSNGMPAPLREALVTSGRALEALYRDAVDIEFTVESGRLYLLQVRAAKRTAAAALRIAADMVQEGLLTQTQALARVSSEQLRKLLRPVFDPAALGRARILAQGLGSSPGQAHGMAVLDSDRAAERAAKGEAVILIRPVTSPQDIRGMLAAAGIVTAKGGALSHAAVVSRALDKPCVVGCNALEVDPLAGRFTVRDEGFDEGAAVSIDGTTGRLYAGSIPMQTSNGHAADVERLLGWADAISGAALWAASRSVADITEAARTRPAGIGVVALTDLLIASGHIDRFVVLLAGLGEGRPTADIEAEITACVQQSCAPAMAAAADLPLHIRLPRVSSDRARRLVENWGELPPRLFLPLGSLAYVRAMLRGMAAAAKAAGHAQVTALLGGVTDAREIDRFASEASACFGLGAGAMIQNIAALQACGSAAAPEAELWIDVAEIVRTLYGFPAEIIEARDPLRDYVEEGNIPLDPLVEFGPLLARTVGVLGKSAGPRVGVDGTGCPSELLNGFFRAGFRVFSVAFPRRDEVRLQLGQTAARGAP